MNFGPSGLFSNKPKLSPEAYIRYPVEVIYKPNGYSQDSTNLIEDFDDLPYRLYWTDNPVEYDYFIKALRFARLQTLDLEPELEQLKTS